MPNKAAKQLEKIKSDKKMLIALVFALVAIFVWVAVSLLATSKKQLTSPDVTKLAEPLVPTLDQQVLEKLEAKRYFDSEELETFPIYALVELDSGDYTLVDVVSQSVQEFTSQLEAVDEEELVQDDESEAIEPAGLLQEDAQLNSQSQLGSELEINEIEEETAESSAAFEDEQDTRAETQEES